VNLAVSFTAGKRMTTVQQPSTKQDILHHLLKQGRSTVQELSERLHVSPQGMMILLFRS
jgi:predicted ArsR family transcriptional regulator